MNQRPFSRTLRRQKGDSKIGCLFWLALLAYFGYVAYQVIPIKMDAAELENFIERKAELASISNASTEKFKREILQRAEELEIPIEADELTVEKTAARVRVKGKYTMPVNLLFREWDWAIELDVERKTLS